jgi:prolycopene isomerase
LNEFFTDQTLISIVAAYWFYSGVPPKELLFSDLAVMIYAYAIFKPWHIKGGSQAMSNALLESFLESVKSDLIVASIKSSQHQAGQVGQT